MPSVEEVFDDDTDFPLPEQQSQTAANYLRNTGSRGALLEEITDDDVDAIADAAGGDFDLDMDRIAEQGKGYGDSIGRPAYTASSSGVQRPSTSSSDLRPTNDRPQQQQQQGPMGGIMGDFMKMQQAEEARMKKLEKQLGSGMVMKDQQEFKEYVPCPCTFSFSLQVEQAI
jgi:signal recognition particle subunit SRP19